MDSSIDEILVSDDKFLRFSKICFNYADKDKSGSISFEEIEKILGMITIEFGGIPPSKEEIKEIREILDEDNSSEIDFDEFCILIKDFLEAVNP